MRPSVHAEHLRTEPVPVEPGGRAANPPAQPAVRQHPVQALRGLWHAGAGTPCRDGPRGGALRGLAAAGYGHGIHPMADRIWNSREHALKLTDVVGYEARCEGEALGEVAGTTYDREQAYLVIDGAGGRRVVHAARVRTIDRDNAEIQLAAGDDVDTSGLDLAEDALLGADFGDPEDRREP
jgi:hypothetical protein